MSANQPPSDDELLRRIGLTDAELRDLQAKFHQFASGLDPAQKNSLLNSIPTAAEAAESLGPDVTAAQLEKFIRDRSPKGAPLVIENWGGYTAK